MIHIYTGAHHIQESITDIYMNSLAIGAGRGGAGRPVFDVPIRPW